MRIGTRGSALALAQAESVAARLADAELVVISNPGDRGDAVGDKSRWVSALEEALLAGEIDVAVHSAKDVPGELAPGTVLAGVPAREDATDVLIGTLGARVGTASLRRAAQLRALDPELELVEIRGNVDTRLRKLDAGEVDGLVLAAAGLTRLGLARSFQPLELVPAPGQGALLLQTRVGFPVPDISDVGASICVTAERMLARHLGASCNTPMGASARIADCGDLELTGWVGLPDGSEWIRDAVSGPAETVADELAERMLSVGAQQLLARAEQQAGAQ
ncbi:MAG: hydroxymethylbilane synthase [Solirubrobacterales bacterium]|nr:hydroxymethylbilane synthase [Solirubrobacterales bacterium]